MDDATNDNADKRWKAVLVYDGGNIGATVTEYFEEIADLDAIIEKGPDWNILVSCTVTLNRKLEAQAAA